jgi:hypothetical protein
MSNFVPPLSSRPQNRKNRNKNDNDEDEEGVDDDEGKTNKKLSILEKFYKRLFFRRFEQDLFRRLQSAN